MPTLGIPTDIVWAEPVESSNVERYGYSASREALIVEFKGNKKVWQYAGPEAVTLFVKMQEAPSAGRFFFAHVRNNGQLKAEELKGAE